MSSAGLPLFGFIPAIAFRVCDAPASEYPLLITGAAVALASADGAAFFFRDGFTVSTTSCFLSFKGFPSLH